METEELLCIKNLNIDDNIEWIFTKVFLELILIFTTIWQLCGLS